MKLKWIVGLVVAIAVLGYSLPLFAEAETATPRFVQSVDNTFSKVGISQVVKAPYKILEKWGNSLESRDPGYAVASEDVVVSEVYNLDAETTG